MQPDSENYSATLLRDGHPVSVSAAQRDDKIFGTRVREAVHCELELWSRAPHLSQLFTGLRMLHDVGRVRFSQRVVHVDMERADQPAHLRFARREHARLVIDGGKHVYFDAHDSHELDLDALKWSDCYFKRSYIADSIPEAARQKVFPLGFCYEVCANGFDALEAVRILRLSAERSRFRELAAYLGRCAGFEFGSGMLPTEERMHSKPTTTEPKVLFMARLWDPDLLVGLPQSRLDKVKEINETRAECIRLLRNTFGERFFGGIEHTPFAVSRYPDVLVPDARLSGKRNYIRLLPSFPICVSTTGLNDSLGFKFGEYVAFSRAIVSEEFAHTLPGNFEERSHYLAFKNPGECVAAVGDLFESGPLREAMMQRNQLYYREFLRPDRMMLRCLNIAMTRG